MNKFLGAAARLALVGFAAPAFAQSNTSTDTASASALVLKAIKVTKTQDLNFGTIVAPNTGSGTAVMSTNGSNTVTPSGGVVVLAPARPRRKRPSPSTPRTALPPIRCRSMAAAPR